ncbi:MAG TPA: MnhB domain-containing protein [Acidimicrobiales bacterium]
MRTVVFLAGAAGVVVLAVVAALHIPGFGSTFHPYRTAAVEASVKHVAANVVSSVNFDQRGLDTLGEESILLASILGAAILLRPAKDETEKRPLSAGRVLESTRMLGYLMMPITLVIGLDVIAHGHVTPGGGFQGGVVVGTGIHLLYVAGSYPALEKARPLRAVEWGEAIGAGAFASLGVAALVASGAFLSNVIGTGSFGQLLSAGTVPLLNGAVGIEVASGTAVLLGAFLKQAIMVKGPDDSR